jgi:flagellar motor switch protein FliM
MPEQEQKTAVEEKGKDAKGAKQRTVVSCNFRSAGRLSNENARTLSAIHDTFARRLATALDAWLGAAVDVKQKGFDQQPITEHIAGIAPLTYIVPFTLTTAQSSMIVECDINLVFAMIELLLGGTGARATGGRDLSEIEEEIMHDVISLIARQAENAWHFANMSLSPGRRIKSSLLHQYCQASEKLAIVKFEIELAGTAGSFQLIFPTAFLTALIQQIKLEQPQKKGGMRYFPRPNIRERILDCDIEVASELPGLRVAVRDLIALEPGSVLKLRAPVRLPGMLTAGGQGIFEAMPVRNGAQKAAQLGRRTFSTNWERG